MVTPEVEQQTQQSTDEREETGLAGRTDRVMDELAWFATSYDDALAALRDDAGQVLDTISEHGRAISLSERDVRRLDRELDRPRFDRGWPYDIWWDENERLWRYVPIDWQRPTEEDETETPVDERAIEALREVTETFVDTFEDRFDPHYFGAEQERQFADSTIDTVARYNARDDTAMVVAGLVRLYRHYETVQSVQFVDSHLSDGPIQNRLVEYLENQGVSTIDGTPLFEIDYRRDDGIRSGHRAFAYSDRVDAEKVESLYRANPLLTIDGSTWNGDQLRLQAAVDALEVSENRLDRAYFVVNEWTEPSSGYYSAELPSQTVFVQRYSDDDAAGAAMRTLLDRDDIARAAGVTIQLGEGEGDWTPVYFPYRAEPWNAAVKQAGRHVLIAGVARRPFEHRTEEIVGGDWTDPLKLSWIWPRQATEATEVN